jgi:ABC transport system ATP-binding/permease protein
MQPEQPPKQRPSAMTIRFVSGPLEGQTFQFDQPVVSLGRDMASDLVIASDLHVSRRHASIVWTGDEWRIKNVSQNATVRVNDQVTRDSHLASGAVVMLGEATSFIVQLAQETVVSTPADTAPSSLTGDASSVSTLPPRPLTTPAASASPNEPVRELGRAYATELARLDELGVPSLAVSSNARDGKTVYPLSGALINIGRDPANDIVIDDHIVSGQHAQLIREGNGYILIHPHPDRASTLNGLYFRGRKIRGDERFTRRLAPGDVFRIGSEEGTLVTLRYQDGSGWQQEEAPPIQPIKLGAPELTIGRDPDNSVVLAHPQVSGRHAKLAREGGAYRVIDLHSTNHIYVNGQPVTSQLLKMGDELRIGPYRLVYETTQLIQYDESQTIRLDAVHLTKRRNKRTLLNDISLSIPPRAFVALVGASGAGKSTLLDALSGLRPADKGTVLCNGQDFYRYRAHFETQIGYVPQEDIVHRELTVERALYYAARLRLPGDFTPAQLEQRISEVLEDVELADQRQQVVKQLSGGQRKRVSLALELLANPGLFFLDEPTSGLDPGLDRKMMALLRKLADKGHTIVLVTHATNNINVCDYVCFLTRGGRLAYFGPPESAKTYFEKTEFAEIYSALEATPERPDAPEAAETRFLASPEYGGYIEQPLSEIAHLESAKPDTRRSWRLNLSQPWTQWVVLTTRYLELLKNDPVNLSILLLQAPVIALLLMSFASSNVFINSNGVDAPVRAPLFLMVVAAVWFGIINAVREIVKEAPIYRRERAMRLGIIPYVFSKVGVLGVLCLVQSLVLIAVMGWKAGYPTHGVFWPPFLELYTALALTSLSGLMIGLTLSAVAPNADRAISLVPLIMLPEIIFSGSLFQLSGVLGGIANLMATRWGFAALGGALHLRYFTFCAPLPPGVSPVGIPHGDCPIGATEGIPDQATFGEFYPTDTKHLLVAWLAQVILILITFALTIYFQKRKDHENSV